MSATHCTDCYTHVDLTFKPLPSSMPPLDSSLHTHSIHILSSCLRLHHLYSPPHFLAHYSKTIKTPYFQTLIYHLYTHTHIFFFFCSLGEFASEEIFSFFLFPAEIVQSRSMVAEVLGLMELVTRDFLGGCAVEDAKDSGLELERHDSVPSKMYLQKHACPLQDLNLFPPAAPATSTKTVPNPYQSVCTIEKVKSALERLERQSQSKQGGRLPDGSPSSSSITTSSIKRRGEDVVEQGDGCDSPGGLIAAACSKCLLYVLISKGDPRCPRCDSHVPTPVIKKKPRIDLNVDFLGI